MVSPDCPHFYATFPTEQNDMRASVILQAFLAVFILGQSGIPAQSAKSIAVSAKSGESVPAPGSGSINSIQSASVADSGDRLIRAAGMGPQWLLENSSVAVMSGDTITIPGMAGQQVQSFSKCSIDSSGRTTTGVRFATTNLDAAVLDTTALALEGEQVPGLPAGFLFSLSPQTRISDTDVSGTSYMSVVGEANNGMSTRSFFQLITVYATTPATSTIIVEEGQAAYSPVTGGVTFSSFATGDDFGSTSSGGVYFRATLSDARSALCSKPAGSSGTCVLVSGDAIPGGGTYGLFQDWGFSVNNSGDYAAIGRDTGAGTHFVAVRNGTVLLRNGMAAPGGFPAGSTVVEVQSTHAVSCDDGSALFLASVHDTGSGIDRDVIYRFDPTGSGSTDVLIMEGDSVPTGTLGLVSPVRKTLGASEDGRFVHFGTGGTSGAATTIYMIDRASDGAAFCLGDGSATACPCGNTSMAGLDAGCANSLMSAGTLRLVGRASVSHDTAVLSGAGMPNSSVLYFQGTSKVASGAGVVFGDGLRCVGGSVIRLTTTTNTLGTSRYPFFGDLPLSVRGSITTSGTTRYYQGWYRNSATFCTADTFNLTNGLQVTWGT